MQDIRTAAAERRAVYAVVREGEKLVSDSRRPVYLLDFFI
jgi:hypothetical protein